MRLRRRQPRRLPDGADRLIATHLGEWPFLTDGERAGVLEATAAFVATKRWEAAQGFVLTEEMCAVIAAQAALMSLGLERQGHLDAFRHVKAIVVHPRTITLDGPARRGDGLMSDAPRHLSGEAHSAYGPVLLAWDAVRRETRHRRTRRNVVIHELAHKLDMLDGVIDGTPPLADRSAVDRWVEANTATYRAVRFRGDDLLDDYAATDAGEFFAVASELFFTDGPAMAGGHPELYATYREFYGYDPAGRRPPPTPQG